MGLLKNACKLSLTNFSSISFIATPVVEFGIRNVARVIRHSRADLCWSHPCRDLLHLQRFLIKFNFKRTAKVEPKAAVVVILHCNFNGPLNAWLPDFNFSKFLLKARDTCFGKPKLIDKFIVFQFSRRKFKLKSLRFYLLKLVWLFKRAIHFELAEAVWLWNFDIVLVTEHMHLSIWIPQAANFLTDFFVK